MKKNILKTLMVAGLVGVAGVGLMTGCEKKETPSTAYIEVEGLNKTWIQGQGITIDGAKVKYYESEDDTIPDVVDLEASMITNFHSSLIGKNTMKIEYNGVTLDVNYTIFSMEQFETCYSTALDNLKNSTCFKIVERSYGANGLTLAEVSQMMVKDEIIFESWEDEGTSYWSKFWTVKEGGKWYKYEQIQNNLLSEIKNDLTDLGVIGNIGDVVKKVVEENESWFWMPDANSYISAETCSGYKYDEEGNQTILTFYMKDKGSSDYGYVRYYIEHNRFVKFENSINSIITMEAIFTYNEEAIEIPAVPVIE